MAKRLIIVQPYVPEYRVPFFDSLVDSLADYDIECVVVAPEPDQELSARNDSAAVRPWHIQTRSRRLRIRGAQIAYLGSAAELRRADGAIVPAAASCVDAYLAQCARTSRGIKLGWWGHIDNYVQRPNRLDVMLETRLMRRSDQVFAYTDAGLAMALKRGVPADRVVSVQNTVDTGPLQRAKTALTNARLQEFKSELGIGRQPTFTFLGGLDASKRVDFLAAVLDELWHRAPNVRFLILGRGNQEHLLRRAIDRGQAIRLGYAGAGEKALSAAVSRALVIPGRVGLVAVDALALGLPILTVADADHAPEIDYLRPGTDIFFAPNEPAAFARYLIAETDTLATATATRVPLLAEMVSRYKSGVLNMFSCN